MHALSLNPSIATLTANRVSSPAPAQVQPQRAVGRPPVGRTLPSRSAVTGEAPRLLVHALRRSMDQATAMKLRQRVETPIGAVRADVVLTRDRRRVALVFEDRRQGSEALLLVYGGFDAVYRISRHDAAWSVTAVTALLESAEPLLFATPGSARLAALPAVRSIHFGRTTVSAAAWDGTPAAVLHRRRINRHSDWVRDFERLVGDWGGGVDLTTAR